MGSKLCTVSAGSEQPHLGSRVREGPRLNVDLRKRVAPVNFPMDESQQVHHLLREMLDIRLTLWVCEGGGG